MRLLLIPLLLSRNPYFAIAVWVEISALNGNLNRAGDEAARCVEEAIEGGCDNLGRSARHDEELEIKGADGAAGVAHKIIGDRDRASLDILGTDRFYLSESMGERFEEIADSDVGLEFFAVVEDEVGHGG